MPGHTIRLPNRWHIEADRVHNKFAPAGMRGDDQV